MRRLAAVPNIFRQRIGLMESCAGIGGARRGFELLGIVPAIYLVSEISEDAVRVLVHQWPDTIWLGKMEDVTMEALRPHASGCPLLQAFFHFAGTPCPGSAAGTLSPKESSTTSLHDSSRSSSGSPGFASVFSVPALSSTARRMWPA